MDALVTGACSRPAMAGLAGAMVPASCSASPGAAMARLPALRASAGSKSRNWRVQAARQPWMALQRSSFLASGMDSAFFDGGVAVSSWAGDSVGVCRGGGGALGAQMNLFERVGRIFRSYANAVVSAAEDPEKLLDQTVLEMQEDLGKMRQASAQVLASQKLLDNKYKAAAQTAEDWYRRAKLALEKGEEDLAREALKRRKEYEESSKALKAQLEQQKGVVDKLIANTRLLESKIQEAKSKKDTLKARAQSAKTSQKVNEMLGSVNTSSALAAFEKMEEKVLALEAQSESLDQLTTDDLAGKFSRLELDTVDDDLAALKRDVLGTSKSSGVLPEGRSPVGSSRESSAYPFKDFEIDKELNELRRKANEL